MTSINDDMDANRRLTALRALAAMNDGRLNETLLRRQLDLFGHNLTRDDVRELLRWLAERDVIVTEMAGGVLMVAEITQRGQDHIERRGDPVEGIALPSRR